MKTVKTILMLLVITTLNFSCSKKDETSPNPENQQSENSFFAKIDGADYNPPSVTSFRFNSTNLLLITGATGTNSEQIQLFMPDDISVGTYTTFYDPLASVYLQAYYSPPTSQEATDDGIADIGELIITAHDTNAKTIEGTFNFNTEPAPNSGTAWQITSGSFKVSYTDL